MSHEDLWKPGNVFKLADLNELSAFEDVVAARVDPDFDAELWATRIALKELVRPKFDKKVHNGRIIKVEFEVMSDPYNRLLDMHERGYSLHKGAS